MKRQINLKELEKACKVVERIARSLGKDCEIIFHNKGVQVAPLSWGGDVQGEDLFEALQDALKEIE